MNVNIQDYGAVADGITVNTRAIQAAIDAAAQEGGRVTVPTGVFLTQALTLRSHVELYLEKGARLLATLRVPEDFPEKAFIYAEGAEDITISGCGTIDGHADDPSYQRFRVNDEIRPNCIVLKNCRQVAIRDIRIQHSGCWTLRLWGCDGVQIRGITIECLKQGNNDGIDVDARNVTISDCLIACDDDGICLKSDIPGFLPENIVVTNCVIASNCNPIKLGTSSYAGFKNVAFSNIVIRPTPESNIWDWSEHYRKIAPGTCTGLAGIAVECVDGGTVENISFDNIIMEGVITPIFVCLNHRHGEKGVLRDLKFRGITAKANGIIPCLISGVPGNAVEDILLRDITVEQEGGEEPAQEPLPENLDGYPENRMYGPWNPAGGLYIRHARSIVIDRFEARHRQADTRPTVVLEDVRDVQCLGLKTVNGAGGIEAKQCENIES